MATVVFKTIPTQITECLAELRLAREIGADDTARIKERRLDWLLSQVGKEKP